MTQDPRPSNPKSPPSSDIDGVHEDRHHVVQQSNAAGETSADLQLAKEDTVARPRRDDTASRDDRTGGSGGDDQDGMRR